MLKQKRPTKSTRQLASPRAPHAPEEGTKSEQGGSVGDLEVPVGRIRVM